MVISHHQKKIGYSGSAGGKHIKGSYRYFSGTKTMSIRARQGDTITVNFSSEVRRGELSLSIVDSSNNLVAALETNTSGVKKINADKKEKYRLVIKGTGTEGNFDLSWDTN